MTEDTYIKLTNLTKLRIAERVLREVLSGDDWGITKETHRSLMQDIRMMIEKIEKTKFIS